MVSSCFPTFPGVAFPKKAKNAMAVILSEAKNLLPSHRMEPMQMLRCAQHDMAARPFVG
jgi:hypothetical protein